MAKTVKSKDVWNSNATTKVDLNGVIVGRYRQTGPNKWDDYEFARGDGGESFEVQSGKSIQVEPLGADAEVLFRVKSGREVLLIRWAMTAADKKEVDSGKWGVQEAEQATRLEKILGLAPKNDPRDDMMEFFLDVKASPKE